MIRTYSNTRSKITHRHIRVQILSDEMQDTLLLNRRKVSVDLNGQASLRVVRARYDSSAKESDSPKSLPQGHPAFASMCISLTNAATLASSVKSGGSREVTNAIASSGAMCLSLDVSNATASMCHGFECQ